MCVNSYLVTNFRLGSVTFQIDSPCRTNTTLERDIKFKKYNVSFSFLELQLYPFITECEIKIVKSIVLSCYDSLYIFLLIRDDYTTYYTYFSYNSYTVYIIYCTESILYSILLHKSCITLLIM